MRLVSRQAMLVDLQRLLGRGARLVANGGAVAAALTTMTMVSGLDLTPVARRLAAAFGVGSSPGAGGQHAAAERGEGPASRASDRKGACQSIEAISIHSGDLQNRENRGGGGQTPGRRRVPSSSVVLLGRSIDLSAPTSSNRRVRAEFGRVAEADIPAAVESIETATNGTAPAE
jgi:hypothetical protein